MAMTRSRGSFFGTDEATGTAVAGGATGNGSEVDVLGDDTSVGDVWLYAVVTSTVAVGSIDLSLNNRRVTTQAYKRPGADCQVVPVNGTQKVPLGRYPASRYMQVDVFNNATGASATVAVLYELEKLS